MRAEIHVYGRHHTKLCNMRTDDPIPREGEMLVREGQMYKVISVQYEMRHDRIDGVVVLVKFVADVSPIVT